MELLNLNDHLWKDRVVLVFSSDTSSVLFKNQIDELIKNTGGLKERKIQYYIVTPENYQDRNGKSTPSSKTWIRRNNARNEFSFQLIGLDGGIKLIRDKIVSAEELFALIDGMPMRREELRKRQY